MSSQLDPEFASATARVATTTPAPAPRSRILVLAGLLLVLLLVWALPTIVEQVEYAINRGRLRARHELAREELKALGQASELVKLSDTSRAFRLVAQKVEASVVHIDVVQVQERRTRIVDEWGLPAPRGRQLLGGQGSGVIIDSAGYVLTNWHVVQNASAIRVRLSDGRTIDDVQVVGHDMLTDLAVLKLSADKLIAAEWGDSEQLEVGDWVLAVGNPYGLDRTVTAGIVSAKERGNLAGGAVDGTVYQNFLQTDAAVNPGNSGGPLVDIAGRVVGINTAIVGNAYQGISFAIPSQIARDVYERLKEGGEVERGWLGVGLANVTPELADALGLTEPKGALVREIVPNSPAATAGMAPGDVVIRWDGRPIQDSSELPLAVAATKVDTTVKVTILRDGAEQDLEVRVERRPSEEELQR